MYRDLEGQVAVVTGAASGIGHGIAKRFLDEGMNVVVNYHSEKRREHAEELARAYNGAGEGRPRVIVAKGDVADERDVENLRDAALGQFGRLDVWVNNAGLETRHATHKRPIEAWEQTLDVNLRGTFLGSRTALAHFLEQNVRGRIVNMSSVHEVIPWPTFADYTASKGGIALFTKTVALEYARFGIRANCVAPGAIETPINAEKFDDPRAREKTESLVPLGRIGTVDEVAACAAWLVSRESRYVTGTSLFVDGGMSLYPSFERGDG